MTYHYLLQRKHGPADFTTVIAEGLVLIGQHHHNAPRAVHAEQVPDPIETTVRSFGYNVDYDYQEVDRNDEEW